MSESWGSRSFHLALSLDSFASCHQGEDSPRRRSPPRERRRTLDAVLRLERTTTGCVLAVLLGALGCAPRNMLGREIAIEERPYVFRGRALGTFVASPSLEAPPPAALPLVVFLEGDGSRCQAFSPGLWRRFLVRYTGDYVLVRPRAYANDTCGTPDFARADFAGRVEELGVLAGELSQSHPGRHLYLVGHSAGAHVAILYAMRHRGEIAGVANLGGGLEPLSEVLPEIERERARRGELDDEELKDRLRTIDQLAFRLRETEHPDAAFWGRTERFWSEMFFAPVHEAWRDGGLPRLVVHGTDDRESVPFSSVLRARAELARDPDVTFELEDDFGHDLLNERVFLAVNRWITRIEADTLSPVSALMR